MKSFKDASGREWRIEINVSTVKRVRSLVGHDLLAVLDNGCALLAKLMGDDLVVLVDVLWAIVQPQASQGTNPITDEQFGGAMGGDSLEKAAEALLAELIDFFPHPGRDKLKSIATKSREIADKNLAEILRKVAEIDAATILKT